MGDPSQDTYGNVLVKFFFVFLSEIAKGRRGISSQSQWVVPLRRQPRPDGPIWTGGGQDSVLWADVPHSDNSDQGFWQRRICRGGIYFVELESVEQDLEDNEFIYEVDVSRQLSEYVFYCRVGSLGASSIRLPRLLTFSVVTYHLMMNQQIILPIL